ncbi:MAG TPA: MBL fold metallo-hydrolase [Dactylosporangium sp.]|jgi:glyoxylase-like metal-dependent hydrolase (beta-lactamase superfamily II)|nr:MBL fold metallo-hydrolase [Dactylosporangium sp.]
MKEIIVSENSRRSFIARSAAAAVVAVPVVAALAGGEPAAAADPLPDYAPIPPSALGPALNAQGYYVGRIERNLYWVTDGTYQAAFLTTRDGVVLFDAPPTIGHNLQRAIDQIAAANGVTNKVTHLVYSHHHADHLGASSLFGRNVVRIGHAETKRLLRRDNDPARPVPDVTFEDRYTLRVGGQRVNLAWHGTNHTPDNVYIHFPDHDTLMLVDVALPGWVPIYNLNLSEDVPGFMAAPGTALSYPWKHYVAGHLGRLGTRDDVVLHQQYVADIAANVRTALAGVDPTPYFVKYGANTWAAVKTYLDAVTDLAAAPVIAKYTGVLAAADVFTASSTLTILESIRLDLGFGSQVHS